ANSGSSKRESTSHTALRRGRHDIIAADLGARSDGGWRVNMKLLRSRGVFAALAVGLAVFGLAACTPFGATITRPSDPVVLDGSALPKLLGTDPMHVVGFAWDGSAWHQIPVQVDQRDLVSPGQIYHLPTSAYPKLFGTTTPYKILVYTPPAN